MVAKMTSKEIAKLAGVSVSTVSLVLNNRPGVGEETRSRVLNILNSHGVFPKAVHNHSKRDVIRFCKIVRHGHILNDRHSMFISEYIEGVVQEAKKTGLSVEVATYENYPIGQIVQDLASRSSQAGSILLATELSQEDITLFKTLKTPHVFLDANYPGEEGSFVTMDNERMVYDALRYLSEAGHRRIGMFTSSGCSNFEAREAAFRSARAILTRETEETQVIPVQSTHDGSYGDIRSFLTDHEGASLPTAFFACNDIVASGAIRALQAQGYRVPDDVSIIGFDDIPVSSLLNPPLTTLSVPKVELGRVSVRLLLNEWNRDSHISSQRSLLGGQLIERESVRSL